ncbi:MAG: nicotinamide mononucleotide transporter [Erysipelotrichaceae bacterium]|nr:nicotinamide mononucleotide transporter [Erysipelotrichaceae bacterium]
MFKSIKENIEPNRKLRIAEIAIIILLFTATFFSFALGLNKINSFSGNTTYVGTVELQRQFDEEDYDEDSTICDVIYQKDDKSLIVSYPYEEYIKLENVSITAYEYLTDNGISLCFEHDNPSSEEIASVYRQVMADRTAALFNISIVSFILGISLLIVLLCSKYFTTYEKCWFLSIIILSAIFAILFPEESANGVNGIVIMFLYLLDIILNILCELLISKQSRYNFLVSVGVEITEIIICIVLMYRFATMVVTLFFWLPIDILSFINWTKHIDDDQKELTEVRKLKGYQEVLVIVGIAVWTLVVGYFISGLNIQTDFFNNRSLETLVVYIDACASAVGIANGLFIFFRLREQWIAWYVCAALESIINILSGQYVLLILKLGYFTNTTYGYIKWSRYIKQHSTTKESVF